MTNVYANADCTISSTASAKSDDGCFRQFSPPRGECTLISSKYSALRFQMAEQNVPTAHLFRTRVLDAPVSKRGWIFQERLLSRRVLHFCSDTVFFECSHGQRTDHNDSEIYRGGEARILFDGKDFDKKVVLVVVEKQLVERSGGQWNPSESARRVLQDVLAAFIKRIEGGWYRECATTRDVRGALDALKSMDRKARLSDRSLIKFNRLWYELVSYYSAGRLTMQTDRLVAIAGIAVLIESKTGASYLAGLWANVALEFGLLWRAEKPEENHPEYCAPSWSWAAVSGVVTLLPGFEATEIEVDFFAQVFRSTVTFKGQQVTAAASLVDGGALEINGPAVEVAFLPETRRKLCYLNGEEPKTFLSFYPDYKDHGFANSTVSLQSRPSSEALTNFKALLVVGTQSP